MKKFENIIIASDLDGTFLSSESKEIARNIDKIKYFTTNGGSFTFATGRTFSFAFPVTPNCREYVNVPLVTANGMVLYDVKRDMPIREKFFDTELMCDIIDYLYDKYPDVCYRAMNDKGMMTFQPENRFIKLAIEDFGTDIVSIVERHEFHKHKFYKLTLRDEYDVLLDVQAELSKIYEGRIDMCFSAKTILEIMPIGMSKATALIELRDMLSASGEKKLLYAVGDHENDIEMLKYADVSVCPANAIAKVKAICDIQLCDNNAGVIADLIEKLDKDIKLQ